MRGYIDNLIRYLKENGFYSFKAAQRSGLKGVHKNRRLSWVKDKLNWSLDDWKRVTYSDESKSNVVGKDGDIRVIRKENKRYKDEHRKQIFFPDFKKPPKKKKKDFIFQEDGASCRTGTIARSWKDDQPEIHNFDYWPAQSPDLNPIEHVWAHFEKIIEWQRQMIKNEEQLKAFLKEEWE